MWLLFVSSVLFLVNINILVRKVSHRQPVGCGMSIERLEGKTEVGSSLASHTLRRERKGLVMMQLPCCHHEIMRRNVIIEHCG